MRLQLLQIQRKKDPTDKTQIFPLAERTDKLFSAPEVCGFRKEKNVPPLRPVIQPESIGAA